MKSLGLLSLLVLLGGCADFEEYVFGPDDYRPPAPVRGAYDPTMPQFGPPAVSAPAASRNPATFQPAVQTREPDLGQP